MPIEEIQREQRWRLVNMPTRPPVIVCDVDKYNELIYWHYDGDSQINESKLDYFLKTFKREE